jgi:hypothetical protein
MFCNSLPFLSLGYAVAELLQGGSGQVGGVFNRTHVRRNSVQMDRAAVGRVAPVRTSPGVLLSLWHFSCLP